MADDEPMSRETLAGLTAQFLRDESKKAPTPFLQDTMNTVALYLAEGVSRAGHPADPQPATLSPHDDLLTGLAVAFERVLIRYSVPTYMVIEGPHDKREVADRGDLSSDLTTVVMNFHFAELAKLRTIAVAAEIAVERGSEFDAQILKTALEGWRA